MTEPTPTLTIRIPADVKANLEASATKTDQSVTDYVVRAIKQRMAGACPSCGRDAGPTPMQPAGYSAAFEAWRQTIRGNRQTGPRVALATQDATGSIVFVGRVTPNDISDSHVTLNLDGQLMPVARQSIIMWCSDGDKVDWFAKMLVDVRGFRRIDRVVYSGSR